ncbi:hypothetical protein K466DRAFT_583156 [Polyporus arcularius HHB13444]|uniref:Uncharacterized protein n=1 Tax=Polyporus arcularius HHB13444 TaxID=1314778 RepID=A0A5C3PMY4_9APHY|nr:hypothetical protein K466DRAFT_583156 [Polyporus arcularius HHB13444]
MAGNLVRTLQLQSPPADLNELNGLVSITNTSPYSVSPKTHDYARVARAAAPRPPSPSIHISPRPAACHLPTSAPSSSALHISVLSSTRDTVPALAR